MIKNEGSIEQLYFYFGLNNERFCHRITAIDIISFMFDEIVIALFTVEHSYSICTGFWMEVKNATTANKYCVLCV